MWLPVVEAWAYNQLAQHIIVGDVVEQDCSLWTGETGEGEGASTERKRLRSLYLSRTNTSVPKISGYIPEIYTTAQ